MSSFGTNRSFPLDSTTLGVPSQAPSGIFAIPVLMVDSGGSALSWILCCSRFLKKCNTKLEICFFFFDTFVQHHVKTSETNFRNSPMSVSEMRSNLLILLSQDNFHNCLGNNLGYHCNWPPVSEVDTLFTGHLSGRELHAYTTPGKG